jgi:hypothetical protein
MPYQLYIEYNKERLVPDRWMPRYDLLEFEDLPKLFHYLELVQDKFTVYHVKKID